MTESSSQCRHVAADGHDTRPLEPVLAETRALQKWCGAICTLGFGIALAWDVTHDGGFSTILRGLGLFGAAGAWCWHLWRRR